jgi:3-methyladenine DNA glycosylase AlkD
MNPHYSTILGLIRQNSGQPTQHTFQDNYLGNTHPRYPISAPVLHKIAKEWKKSIGPLPVTEFEKLITGLIQGKSSTEKCMAGILLSYSTADQRKFNPERFDSWLDHVIGWAEVDSLCSGAYTVTEIPQNFKAWKKLLVRFSKSKNINKRRASLVFLCAPLRSISHNFLADVALDNIDRLKHEKEILITKAISWLLRSMVKHHRKDVEKYLKKNLDVLPAIAVRETLTKLKTGRKAKKL